jgi:hypothetical protein
MSDPDDSISFPLELKDQAIRRQSVERLLLVNQAADQR